MRSLRKNRRGQLALLLSSGILVIIIIITLGLGGKILTDMRDGATVNSSYYNSTGMGGVTLSNMSQYLPTVGIVIVVAVILGILITYLYSRFSSQ